MEDDMTTIRVREKTRDRFNLRKLENKFSSQDEFLGFLLNLFEHNKEMIVRGSNRNTSLEQIDTKKFIN